MTKSSEAIPVVDKLGKLSDDQVIPNDNSLHHRRPTEYNARIVRACR